MNTYKGYRIKTNRIAPSCYSDGGWTWEVRDVDNNRIGDNFKNGCESTEDIAIARASEHIDWHLETLEFEQDESTIAEIKAELELSTDSTWQDILTALIDLKHNRDYYKRLATAQTAPIDREKVARDVAAILSGEKTGNV